ncbi:dedicator of cytokinesis protein 1 [Epargyreus clarus]|uniref:dedicator of cytokinesis protein 1 n=1 Tax=Epargyreus clarus TaxID=520877 RepID=UPI003C2BD5C7
MTVWRKLENENCYAVAIYNYTSQSPHLSVEVGELVELQGETEEWYWAKSIRHGVSGALPKTYVVVRECHVEKSGEMVVASVGDGGVMHDIAVTLREWLQQWKTLYITNDERFKFMEVSMLALLQLRGQAASGALPQDQLRRVARTALFTIDKGNRMLGMELAVRTSSGQLVDPLSISAYKLNAMHDEANARIDKNMETTPSSDRPSSGSLTPATRSYTIVARVHNFVCRMADAAELLLALHTAHGDKLTESVLLRWPPHTAHVAAATTALFTDLGSDIKKEKIFLVCHVVRIGAMEPQNVDHRRSTISAVPAHTTGVMRRPFGIACADVTKYLAADDPDKDIQLPFYPCEKEYMDTLLKKVIANRDLKDTKHPQGLWVSLQLVEGDLKQIHEEQGGGMGTCSVARKMGFPEVILPGDARNDLYVTLSAGAYSRSGGKSSDRNIELLARVLDSKGRMVPGVISVGAGVPRADEYTSLVYYHDDRPRWQETFKVCLNIEAFKDAHLVFLCRHRSSNEAKDRAEKYFALSYLRLMQREGTTTPDTTHNLCVYKIEHKRSVSGADAEAEAGAVCLALPARKEEVPAGADRGLTRGPLTLLQRDCLAVATRLCSTKLTQREEILGVLKWNTHHAEGTLRAALGKLLRVPSEELVKFLRDILDALFSILTQVDEDEEEYKEESYAVLVLDCLLRVISLVSDHKYQHFQPVLLVYIESSFCDTLAYEKLISVMVWAIRSAESGEGALKRLLQCMKCLESLARLLVRSRQLRAALGGRATLAADMLPDEHYCFELEEFLKALVWLMRCGDHALTCQGSALKYLPHAIPHLIHIYPTTELSAYCVLALEALPLGRLAKQRLLALLELVKGPLATHPQARALLLPHLANTLQKLLKASHELEREAAHKLRSVDKAARLLGADSARREHRAHRTHLVELCVETLGEVVSLLAREDVGPVEADRGEVARCLLPTVMRTAAAILRDRSKEEPPSVATDQLLRRLVCVLLEMVRQMSPEQYTAVVRSIEAEATGGAAALAADSLAFVAALLHRPVFRPHWADMLHLQHYVMLHALGLLATTLNSRLHTPDAAEADVVKAALREWFVTTGLVAAAKPLQLEALSAARRQRAYALYGDLRRTAANLLQDMWYSLGDHKHSFIPFLVGPFLEVSFLRDEVVRNTTIPLFFDMMQTEYSHNVASGECEEGGLLRTLESELIDKLDVLAEAGLGDAAWRRRFVSLCGALVARAEPLRAAGAALVAAVARQLDALLQYRAAATPHRMHLISGVLRFYEQIERPHMYIRYVHRLAEMHKKANHWTEAGLALMLHAKLLDWSDDPLPPRLRHPNEPVHATHRELKKALYLEVAVLVSAGRQWELAVAAVQELIRVVEECALGYAPLAELHAYLAELYAAMMRSPRLHPAYFRVIYHGKGFPQHLRLPNGFVYRGNECDKLHDFEERMLDEWPDAEVLLKLDPPGEEITESDGQYLQINAVDPIMGDKLKRLSGKPVDEQILQYYERNNVDKFVFSRPYYEDSSSDSGDETTGKEEKNEFARRWVERTELEISDTLPGILRWFPVISVRTYKVSPLKLAVETLTGVNRELKVLARNAKSPDSPLFPLTLRLSGILDSAVQGGLVNYERAFMTAAYEARHPRDAALLQRLRDLIADQVPLLKYALEVHAQRDPAHVMYPHLLECFRKLQQHVHQRYGRKMCDFEPDTPEVQLRISLRAADTPPPAAHRVSDISTGNESANKSKFSFNNAINLVRNSGNSGTLTPRRDKKRIRKSEVGMQSASHWYTSAAANGITSAINASVHNTLAFNNNNSSVLNNTNNSNSNSSPLHNSNSSPALDTPSASPLRELRQEVRYLFSERPLRADVERERRLSQRASFLTSSEPPSNRDSMGTTDSNQDDEEPPPLPVKVNPRSVDLDAENNNAESNPHSLPARHNYDLVVSPRQSYLYQSKRRTDKLPMPPCNEKAPTPPPKKKNQSTA